MSPSTFRVLIQVPREVRSGPSSVWDRESFFLQIWNVFSDSGLLGVHEGTLLSEEAEKQGFTTESWVLDAGEAPRDRDWISSLKNEEAELYFASKNEAEAAAQWLKRFPEVIIHGIEEQGDRDWDAEWKASFEGVLVPPFWNILPPWKAVPATPSNQKEVILRINPGAGFGTGTHETTQLCLEKLGDWAGRFERDAQVLDFGSGSGILSVGAALLGARVDGVEIDPLAIENAQENAELSGVRERIRYTQQLHEPDRKYRLVIANILRPVLMHFAEDLVRRIEPQRGLLLLSGLMEPDVAIVSDKYSALLGRVPEIRCLREWRALAWDLS